MLPALSFAQEYRVSIDKSRMPVEANAAADFVPRGWELEEQASGDLNGDSVPDVALKLIQARSAGGEDKAEELQRALVVLFKGGDGKLRRAAVADKLLQCGRCGGAFYGVATASADVKIERGVLVVTQDHGSRNVVEQTFRFRYEPASKKMLLIGYDMTDHDRLTGENVEESTNFITGLKIVKRSQYDERLDKQVVKSNTRSRVVKGNVTIEEVDYEKY